MPAEGRIAFRPASFLRHNRVLWKMGAQPGDDGLFGALIGLRHNVDFPLVADLHRPVEFRKQNRARFPRCFNGHIQK